MLMKVNQGTKNLSNDSKQSLIVVLDDHVDSLVLLNFILGDICDAQIINFNKGGDLLEQATELQPDLILMDIILPDINGVEIMQQLRQRPSLLHVPIIAVTAWGRKDDRTALIQAGFTDYVSKPYLFEDMEVTVSRYLSFDAKNAKLT
jgi:two-component system, cell cycle response regulator DivK